MHVQQILLWVKFPDTFAIHFTYITTDYKEKR